MKIEDVKLGMTVVLNSGGPIMTINSSGDENIGVVWFPAPSEEGPYLSRPETVWISPACVYEVDTE